MSEELETWENVSRGRVVIKHKAGEYGRFKDELVNGGKKFHITQDDRRLNQELAANDGLDPFMNGILSPVRLLENSEDAEAILANPNVMGESEMADLVKGHFKSLEKRLGDITNPVTLERLLAVAKQSDASVSKVEAITARLQEVAPSLANEILSSPLEGDRVMIPASTTRS